ncbi:MAG: hypothetical protein J6Z16_02395 [Candidatus Methanomethylophilaceae archaeon]|nr:hypothetical protein [Candidatus Methanomethylophilaceae archaeon]
MDEFIIAQDSIRLSPGPLIFSLRTSSMNSSILMSFSSREVSWLRA